MNPLDRDDAPAFSEPWEAQAFAMAVKLHETGLFSWTEWAEALAAEIRANPALDDGRHYYEHWLAALEKLIAAKGVITDGERERRAEAWQAAAGATPHGQPIELSRASQIPETFPAASRKAPASTR